MVGVGHRERSAGCDGAGLIGWLRLSRARPGSLLADRLRLTKRLLSEWIGEGSLLLLGGRGLPSRPEPLGDAPLLGAARSDLLLPGLALLEDAPAQLNARDLHRGTMLAGGRPLLMSRLFGQRGELGRDRIEHRRNGRERG